MATKDSTGLTERSIIRLQNGRYQLQLKEIHTSVRRKQTLTEFTGPERATEEQAEKDIFLYLYKGPNKRGGGSGSGPVGGQCVR